MFGIYATIQMVILYENQESFFLGLKVIKLSFFCIVFQDLLTMNEELKKARKAFDAESYGEMV